MTINFALANRSRVSCARITTVSFQQLWRVYLRSRASLN